MLKLDVSNISPRSDREATAGTLFQFIVYRNRVDVGDYSPSTSHCTVRTGLVYGATYI